MKKIITLSSALLCSAVIFSSAAFAGDLLPVRKTLEERGYTIGWDEENQSVIIEKGDYKRIEPVGDVITLDHYITYAPEEFFNEIEAASSVETEPKLSMTATVKDININEGYILAANEARGDIMFRFDDKTNFHHEKNKMFYTAADIVVGMELEFCHNEAMTMSLPPQTYAYEIIFHDAEADISTGGTAAGTGIAIPVAMITTATVKEVNDGYILAESEEKGEIMFLVDENTHFHHEKNKMFYTISDVEVGEVLDFIHSDVMTLSLPPQIYASEVVFH